MAQRHNNDFIQNYYDYGIDPRRRRLFLHGDIEEETISTFIQGLLLLDEGGETIEIILSSCGGEALEMFAAYDIISSCKAKVVIYAVGKIMSAAVLVLAAGDERYAYPNTRFMCHESAYELDERHGNAKTTVAEYEEMEKIYNNRLAERTKLSAKQWMKLTENTGKDKYFGPDKALKYGLIDGIIMPDGTIDDGEE